MRAAHARLVLDILKREVCFDILKVQKLARLFNSTGGMFDPSPAKEGVANVLQ